MSGEPISIKVEDVLGGGSKDGDMKVAAIGAHGASQPGE